MDLPAQKHAFHDLEVQGGVLADECALPLRQFFRSRRRGAIGNGGSRSTAHGRAGDAVRDLCDVVDDHERARGVGVVDLEFVEKEARVGTAADGRFSPERESAFGGSVDRDTGGGIACSEVIQMDEVGNRGVDAAVDFHEGSVTQRGHEDRSAYEALATRTEAL